MDIFTGKSDQSAYKVYLKNSISDNTKDLNLLEDILGSYGYKNTQYAVIKSSTDIRLEVEDNDSKKLDELVNQLWDNKLLASNEEENLAWF